MLRVARQKHYQRALRHGFVPLVRGARAPTKQTFAPVLPIHGRVVWVTVVCRVARNNGLAHLVEFTDLRGVDEFDVDLGVPPLV